MQPTNPMLGGLPGSVTDTDCDLVSQAEGPLHALSDMVFSPAELHVVVNVAPLPLLGLHGDGADHSREVTVPVTDGLQVMFFPSSTPTGQPGEAITGAFGPGGSGDG